MVIFNIIYFRALQKKSGRDKTMKKAAIMIFNLIYFHSLKKRAQQLQRYTVLISDWSIRVKINLAFAR